MKDRLGQLKVCRNDVTFYSIETPQLEEPPKPPVDLLILALTTHFTRKKSRI